MLFASSPVSLSMQEGHPKLNKPVNCYLLMISNKIIESYHGAECKMCISNMSRVQNSCILFINSIELQQFCSHMTNYKYWCSEMLEP